MFYFSKIVFSVSCIFSDTKLENCFISYLWHQIFSFLSNLTILDLFVSVDRCDSCLAAGFCIRPYLRNNSMIKTYFPIRSKGISSEFNQNQEHQEKDKTKIRVWMYKIMLISLTAGSVCCFCLFFAFESSSLCPPSVKS